MREEKKMGIDDAHGRKNSSLGMGGGFRRESRLIIQM